MTSSSGQKVILVPRLSVCPTTASGFDHLALGKLHLINFAIFEHLHNHLLRERIDARNPHAMKTSRDFVGVFIELTAGMQNRHDHFKSRNIASLLC